MLTYLDSHQSENFSLMQRFADMTKDFNAEILHTLGKKFVREKIFTEKIRVNEFISAK